MAAVTTLPAAFTVGQVLTSTQMNNLRGAFRILQVVSTTLTSTFTSSSTTFTNMTGLTVSITPSFNTSKILVIASLTGSNDVAVTSFQIRLARDGTGIFVGDAASNRTPSQHLEAISGSSTVTPNLTFLDSPASTSAITYSVQGRNVSAGTFYINRTKTDSDTAGFPRSASSITVMEISA